MVRTHQKTLRACLSDITDHIVTLPADTVISGIAWDSRKVKPGDVFFAMRGSNLDGHQFISQAVKAGAAAVIGSQRGLNLPVPYVQLTGDEREMLGLFSSAFYEHPSQQMVVIGVTGTDGKTTTTNLIYHILRTAGFKVGMISTVNAVIGDEILDTGFHTTTPEAPDIQRYLSQMVAAGLTHVVLEATSHGLAQRRVAGVHFNLAVVTNVTHEHFDYHGSYENYLAAKGLLFDALSENTPQQTAPLAVLNLDDVSYNYLSQKPAPQLSYSLTDQGDIWAEDIINTPAGLSFTVHGIDETFKIEASTTGRYNVMNLLAALGVTIYGLQVPVSVVQAAMKSFPQIPGRMEKIDMGQDFLAIVDFAHTPNAIRQALQSARELTNGKIIAVFGSAGLRDVEKRKLMPEIAASLADYMFLTAEDPRTESLDAILADMAMGAVRGGGIEGETFWREPDRGTAICRAVDAAEPGDLVVTCGKGHEQSMCFGDIEYAWDDRIALRAALARRLGVSGPKMPELPTRPEGFDA